MRGGEEVSLKRIKKTRQAAGGELFEK